MENDRIQQGYEKIKQGLENAGFIRDDERHPDGIFEKVINKHQLVIVNDVEQVVESHITLGFKYIGDGYTESENGSHQITYGFSFYVNDEHVVDLWVKDMGDLMSYFEH